MQRQAVSLRDAVAASQASPGNLAYLEDRVLVGRGEPQIYGTQIGCGPDGPEPAKPIAEEANVDDRRIDPLADSIHSPTTSPRSPRPAKTTRCDRLNLSG
jgi:hypothetical protein